MFVVSSFLSDLDFRAASQPNQVTVPLSHSPPGILARVRAGSHSTVHMATLFDESNHDA